MSTTPPSLLLMPDVERLVIDFLLGDPDVDAVFAGRIYGAVPNEKTFPLARVVRWGGEMLDGGEPYWADAPALQVDVWAARKAEAMTGAELIRAALGQRLAGRHPTGVVAGIDLGTLVYDPDNSFSPAKPRARLDVDLVTRPPAAPVALDRARGAPRVMQHRPDAPVEKASPR